MIPNYVLRCQNDLRIESNIHLKVPRIWKSRSIKRHTADITSIYADHFISLLANGQSIFSDLFTFLNLFYSFLSVASEEPYTFYLLTTVYHCILKRRFKRFQVGNTLNSLEVQRHWHWVVPYNCRRHPAESLFIIHVIDVIHVHWWRNGVLHWYGVCCSHNGVHWWRQCCTERIQRFLMEVHVVVKRRRHRLNYSNMHFVNVLQ